MTDQAVKVTRCGEENKPEQYNKVYYTDKQITIRDMRQEDAAVITQEEIAQGWDAPAGQAGETSRRSGGGISGKCRRIYQCLSGICVGRVCE